MQAMQMQTQDQQVASGSAAENNPSANVEIGWVCVTYDSDNGMDL